MINEDAVNFKLSKKDTGKGDKNSDNEDSEFEVEQEINNKNDDSELIE